MSRERVKAVLARARSLVGEATGTLLRGSESFPFTKGRIVGPTRAPQGGHRDHVEAALELDADGLETEPKADDRLTLDAPADQAGAWLVASVEPIAPGGRVAGWRLSLATEANRDE